MTKPPLHERLKFDTAAGQVTDEDRRYVLLRADVLMGLFEHLPPEARRQGFEAFTASVFKYGRASVRAYDDPSDPGALRLFDTVAQGAASLGWGKWTFDVGERTCRLTVVNSPFAAAAKGRGEFACAPIVGMLQAVCTHAWKHDCEAREIACSACDGDHAAHAAPCIFEASIRP
jgi:predicted hydrocarbon binding protein